MAPMAHPLDPPLPMQPTIWKNSFIETRKLLHIMTLIYNTFRLQISRHWFGNKTDSVHVSEHWSFKIA